MSTLIREQSIDRTTPILPEHNQFCRVLPHPVDDPGDTQQRHTNPTSVPGEIRADLGGKVQKPRNPNQETGKKEVVRELATTQRVGAPELQPLNPFQDASFLGGQLIIRYRLQWELLLLRAVPAPCCGQRFLPKQGKEPVRRAEVLGSMIVRRRKILALTVVACPRVVGVRL